MKTLQPLAYAGPGARRPKSSPVLLQHKLTLSDLPMDHGFQDAQQRAVTSRQERSRMHDRVQSARAESETLREYSRQRFQSVVEDMSPRISPPPPPTLSKPARIPPLRSRPGTCVERKTPRWPGDAILAPPPPTNGPTKLGSILYQDQSLLQQLSSRVGQPGGKPRPFSEPPSRFDHLRRNTVNYPVIRQLLEASNCEYRAVPSPCHTQRGGFKLPLQDDDAENDEEEDDQSHDDPHDLYSRRAESIYSSPFYDEKTTEFNFWLVPVDAEFVDEDDDASVAPRSEAHVGFEEGEGPLRVSTARSRSPGSLGSQRSGSDVNMADLSARDRGQLSEEDRIASPGGDREEVGAASPALGVPPLDLRPRPASPQEPPREPPRGDVPPTVLVSASPTQDRPPSAASSARRKAARRKSKKAEEVDGEARPESSCSARSAASSSSSSLSSVHFTPRPRCWVDDVTVSSDESVNDRDASLATPDPDRQPSVASEEPQEGGVGGKGPLSALPPRTVSPGGGGGKKLGKLGKPALKGKAGKGGGVGGCPRSLKQSEASGGSKAGGPEVAAVPVVEVAVEAEKEEEAEPELVLPRFICPSSETKSRQTALKHWLAKSSFQEAVRTVPMV